MIPYFALREECCDANRQLAASGLVELTFGNVSVLDRAAGVFAIKPSGVAYDALTPEHSVVLDLEGQVVAGELRPSSDTPTHRRLFAAFPDARAVVHTHSRAATAFAQAERELPCLGTTHADFFPGPVPLTRPLTEAEIGGDYELATGDAIVERFRGAADLDPSRTRAVLVRGHGPFVWADSSAAALELAVALELVAGMAAATLALAPHAPPLGAVLRDKHFSRKHGKHRYYGQST